ncbi:LacI family DNA-binding transcriptional regulator [Fusobacterium varium]
MNMKDIAAHLGISVATVSRAINGSENINLETKERILAFVEKKGYTPNVIARNLSKMENNTIALLVPNISNPFFASLINNICANFAKSDYQIALYNTSEDIELEKKAIKNIIGQRIAGVIAILINGKYEENPLLPLINYNIPVFLLDRDIRDYTLPGVFLDNYIGAYKVVTELLKRGHKDIAIITGDLSSLTAEERLKGYIKAHEDMNIPYSKANIYEGNFLLESGSEAGKKILNSSATAVFASNNLMLLGFLKTMKVIGKEIELSCFEEIEYLQVLGINVICCKIPLDVMGEKTYSLFFTDKSKRKKIYIEPILIKNRKEF